MITDTKAPSAQSLVINRAKWLRGEGFWRSQLLRVDDKMCCLGFYGLACGLTSDRLRERKAPHSSDAQHAEWPEWLFEGERYDASNDASKLMSLNDRQSLPDAEREQEIASIFAKHGVTVTFVDGDASESEPSKPLETK